jgi:pyrroloquinoline quinone biosynthesis protein D
MGAAVMARCGMNSDAPDGEWRPRLAAGVRLRVDPADGRERLLFPEAALELNETAAAIVRLCDGRRSLAEIVGELTGRYGTTGAIARETAEFLGAMRERRLVE